MSISALPRSTEQFNVQLGHEVLPPLKRIAPTPAPASQYSNSDYGVAGYDGICVTVGPRFSVHPCVTMDRLPSPEAQVDQSERVTPTPEPQFSNSDYEVCLGYDGICMTVGGRFSVHPGIAMDRSPSPEAQIDQSKNEVDKVSERATAKGLCERFFDWIRKLFQ